MVKDFDAEIAQKQAEISELQREKHDFESLTEDQRLAITLHDLLCRWNHTDGCGWLYEFNRYQHAWLGSAHSKWLNKAIDVRQRLDGMSNDEIIAVARALN